VRAQTTAQRDATFGQILRRHRLLAGLSQEVLAERARVSLNAVGSLERGINRRPHPMTVGLLADALGLQAEHRESFFLAARPDIGDESNQRSRSPRAAPEGSPADRIPSNLPAWSTSFVGRECDVAAVQLYLRQPEVRLVTLTGPGGVGKTRLALQAADGLRPDFPDGVFFVSLAAIRDSSFVISTIAQVLGVRGGSECLYENVVACLHQYSCLIVCDNFEQVLGAGPLLAGLLAEAPGLKVLVTSRSVLHLQIEREMPVLPLDVPEFDRFATRSDLPAGLASCAAVQLFVTRARDVRPNFKLTSQNAQSIVEICRRLDGVPLAIELAAARIRVLPPAALLARLERRLPLLTGGARDLPARQQTMRDAIAWSVDLLDPDEKSVFRRLAVFVNGCTLEAAEAVVSEGASVLAGIEVLVASNLLRLQDGLGGEPRFLWLETIREYAWELLERSAESVSMRDRHAAWYLRLLDSASPSFILTQTAAGLDRLDEEYDNLRAALHWLCESGDIERALRFGAGVWSLWFVRGHQAEARIRLEELLALPGVPDQPSAAAQIHIAAGLIAFIRADYVSAETHLEAAIAFARLVGDQAQVADALVYLGACFRSQNDFARAIPRLNESLAIARKLGHRGREASALAQLGIVARQEGDLSRARALLQDTYAITEDLGTLDMGVPEVLISIVTLNLALIAEDDGHEALAWTYYQQCLVAAGRVAYVFDIALALEGFASLAARAGQSDRALRLVGGVARLRQETQIKIPPMMQGRLDRTLDLSRRLLAPESAEAALAEGRGITWREASSYALDAAVGDSSGTTRNADP
jgi:predicted ATPase/transcriptional regulator with XRE-family HTH domain